jgi:aromatic-L-amino-acid/L-tryptophan decarboxylase
VWLSLQQAGRKGIAQMISDDICLSRELFERIGACPELQPLTQSLSIATFRFVPADLDPNAPESEAYLDKLNRELLTRLQNSGEVYLSNAVIDGKFALRACIVNFRTSVDDIKELPFVVVRLGKGLDSELRESPSQLGCSAAG